MAFTTLSERLKGPIADALKQQLSVTNTHALPSLEKVVVNVGINKQKMDSKEMHQYIVDTLTIITGQRPILRPARISVSNFKIREGGVVGACVTLRGKRMYAFLDKLIHVALPRVRDFRGLKSKLDGQGNYSIGIKEHTIFPEVPLPDPSKIFGLEVTIKTTTNDDTAAMALFKEMGIPFRRDKQEEASVS